MPCNKATGLAGTMATGLGHKQCHSHCTCDIKICTSLLCLWTSLGKLSNYGSRFNFGCPRVFQKAQRCQPLWVKKIHLCSEAEPQEPQEK